MRLQLRSLEAALPLGRMVAESDNSSDDSLPAHDSAYACWPVVTAHDKAIAFDSAWRQALLLVPVLDIWLR